MPLTPRRSAAALAALLSALLVVAGCRRAPKPDAATAREETPTVRLYLMSDVAGALEPCGCSKDQLGGFDHLAAYIRAQRENAPRSVVISAGPLLYIDPTLVPERAAQDRWKAEALADAMKSIGLAAWTPGYNDWADGNEGLARAVRRSGARVLGAGLNGVPDEVGVVASTVVLAGDVKVGIVGVSVPVDANGKPPEGVTPPQADAIVPLVRRELDLLRQQGARVLVASVAMQRGAALRIADACPELDVLVVGKELGRGHGNTTQPTPELIGSTVVVETANHAQTLAVVDIHLRGDDPDPRLSDAGGIAQAAKVSELSKRIRELETRIHGWESGGRIDPADLADRKRDLAKLRDERASLEANQPSLTGSHFRFAVHEVREGMGTDAGVSARMLELYKQVNAHNKVALADLKPPPPEKGRAGYIGVEECTTCHEEERAVWDKTAHAHAYKTLVDGFKEYNLECVSCHVTGFGKPGGSTVTHNANLQSVQCEECHGPGALHAKSPETRGLVVLRPDPKSCVEACHHPPHVEAFDAEAAMERVLGPGHGRD